MPTNRKLRRLMIPIFMIGLTIVSLTATSRTDIVIDWNVQENADPGFTPESTSARLAGTVCLKANK